jgi:hypothetical protein
MKAILAAMVLAWYPSSETPIQLPHLSDSPVLTPAPIPPRAPPDIIIQQNNNNTQIQRDDDFLVPLFPPVVIPPGRLLRR